MNEVVYVSAARTLLDPLQLGEILSVARRNNAQLGVTGILLYHQGSFMQVLEGAEDALSTLFERICRDPRHTRIVKLRERAITTRGFGAWSMGFVSLDSRLLSELPGRHALSSNGSLDTDASIVLPLLDQFRQGQYHRYVMA
jgi:hypothetical protein